MTVELSLGRESRILVDYLFKLFGRLFKNNQGFPGGSVVKKKEKSTCQGRRHEFNPYSRKIPCAMEQLSPCGLEPVLHNKRRHCNEKSEHHNWRIASARHKLRKTHEQP